MILIVLLLAGPVEFNCEMTHDGCFLNDLQSVLDVVSPFVNIGKGGSNVIHVIVGIHSARNGQAQEFEGRVAVFAGFGVTIGQQGANFYTPDPAFNV